MTTRRPLLPTALALTAGLTAHAQTTPANHHAGDIDLARALTDRKPQPISSKAAPPTTPPQARGLPQAPPASLFEGPNAFANDALTGLFIPHKIEGIPTTTHAGDILRQAGSLQTPEGTHAALYTRGYTIEPVFDPPRYDIEGRYWAPYCLPQEGGVPDYPVENIRYHADQTWLALGDLPGGAVDAEAQGSMEITLASGTIAFGQSIGGHAVGLFAAGISDAGILSPMERDPFVSIAALHEPPSPFKQPRAIDRIESPSAFAWTNCVGMFNLGELPGGGTRAIATDAWFHYNGGFGYLAVGASESELGVEAFIWTTTTGMLRLGAHPSGDGRSCAYQQLFPGFQSGIPELIAIGATSTDQGIEACYWTQTTNNTFDITTIGDLPGGEHLSVALDRVFGFLPIGPSFDPPFQTVGWSSSANGDEAFLFHEETGIHSLGDIPQNQGATRSSVALAGTNGIIVGRTLGHSNHEAFIWTEAEGMLPLKQTLETMGFDLTGWTLTEATHIQGNPRPGPPSTPNIIPHEFGARTLTISGNGINPQGIAQPWTVRLLSRPGDPAGAPVSLLEYRILYASTEIQLTASAFGAQALPGEPTDFDANSIIDLQDLNTLLATLGVEH